MTPPWYIAVLVLPGLAGLVVGAWLWIASWDYVPEVGGGAFRGLVAAAIATLLAIGWLLFVYLVVAWIVFTG